MAGGGTIGAIGIVLHDFSGGGTESVATRLAAQWAAAGIAVTIFCGSRSGPVASAAQAGVTIVEARPVLRRTEGSRPLLARAAARHFREHPVDLVLLPGNIHWPVVGPLARLPGRPPVVVQVGAALRRQGVRGLAAIARRWQLRGVAALVMPSLDPDGPGVRIAGRRVQPLPLAVIAQAAPPPPPADGAPLLLALGRAGTDPGLPLLIAALPLIGDGTARLAIIGAGANEAYLAQIAERAGLAGRVRFAGSGAALETWLDRVRMLLLPTASTTHGAALVEALAAGRGVLAAEGTAGERLLDRAAIVPAGTLAEGWARAIDAALSRPIDPAALAAATAPFTDAAAAAAWRDAFETIRR